MANQSLEAEIIRTLREIQRLQTQARKYRRQLKSNQKDLRFHRKKLRALQASLEERRPDVAPMRLLSNVAGIAPAPRVLGLPVRADASVPPGELRLEGPLVDDVLEGPLVLDMKSDRDKAGS